VPVRSHDIPPDRWRPSSTTTSSEHYVLKRAINYWQAPRHPTYNSLSARLQSFKNWPHNETQTPEALSEAGFYYDGKNFLLLLLLLLKQKKYPWREFRILNHRISLSRYSLELSDYLLPLWRDADGWCLMETWKMVSVLCLSQALKWCSFYSRMCTENRIWLKTVLVQHEANKTRREVFWSDYLFLHAW
jgi:hypothetical protein